MQRVNQSIRNLIIDMDGVLWRESEPIGDLPTIFSRMSHLNLNFILASNNATKTIDQLKQKLKSFGVEINPKQVINSAFATAMYLSKKHPQGGPVFIIGEEGLIRCLAEFNFYHDEQNVLAVVVALDRNLTYQKLKQASLLIMSGIPWIGTNPDRTFPTSEGLIPGAGAIIAALEAATGIQPKIIGKPQPEIYLAALSRLGATPSETMVIGDRLDTDIVGAQKIGCPTALVLSGVTSQSTASLWQPAPDIIADDLNSVLDYLEDE